MSQPWEDFQSSTNVATQTAPWEDFRQGGSPQVPLQNVTAPQEEGPQFKPYKPNLYERVFNRPISQDPLVSFLFKPDDPNAVGQRRGVFTPDPNIHPIPTMGEQKTKLGQVAAPFVNLIPNFVNASVGNPLAFAGMATPGFARAGMLGFAGQAATQVPGELQQAKQTFQNPKSTLQQKIQAVVNPVESTGFAGLGLLGAGHGLLDTTAGRSEAVAGTITKAAEELRHAKETGASPEVINKLQHGFDEALSLAQETLKHPAEKVPTTVYPVQPNHRKKVGQGSIGQGIKEAVDVNKEKGAIPLSVLKEYLTKENEKRPGFTLDAPLTLLDPQVSGFATESQPQAQQVLGRLENLSKTGKISPAELDVYKRAGLEEFLSTRPKVKEVAQWMQENGPRVETRVLRSGGNVAGGKFEQTMHEIETAGYHVERIADSFRLLNNQGNKIEPMEFTQREKDWMKSLSENLRPSEDFQRSSFDPDIYRSIAPKDKDQTVVMVRVPEKRAATPNDADWEAEGNPPETIREERGILHEGQHFGTEDRNVLGWARIQYEDTPKGKVAHVIEAQSDWGQQLREAQKEGVKIGSLLDRNPDINHPLLKDYNRLILKAAIEQARKDGAVGVVVSDAETAMMSEGHDLYRGGDYGAGLLNNPAEQVERTFGHGMRLNYDKILPGIMEELTGKKGERMDLGEHQRAFETTASRTWNPDDFNELGEKPHPRQNLIFRSPDGTPKVNATGLFYPLSEEGKTPFSLFGKRSPKVEVEDVHGGGEGELTKEQRLKSRQANSPQSWESFRKALENKEPPKLGPEAGFVQIPQGVQDWVEEKTKTLRDTVEKVQNHFQTKRLREVITYTRDATDNQPKLYARQGKNNALNVLENVTTKENLPVARRAMFAVVEAKGQIKALDEMRRELVNSTKANPKNKRQALEAIDYARTHWSSLQEPAKRYNQFTDQQIKAEQAAGFDTPVRQGYVHHAQDIDTSQGFFDSGGKEGGTSFKKQRVYETYAKSIAAGVEAKTLDAYDLLEHRLAVGQKMVAMKEWVDGFRKVQDPVSKTPLIRNVKMVTRPDGSTYVDTPHGYSKEFLGGQVVAVHNGYAGLFSALTDPSWWSKSAARENLLKLNATAKVSRLFLDTFHLGRVGVWNALIRATDLKVPNPFGYRKGETLLDHDIPTINNTAAKGEIPKGWVKDLVENKRRLDLGVKEGFNIGRITDSLHQDWVQSLQGIGGFNKWLFDSFQRGAMSEIYLMEYDRVREGSPKLTDQEVARRVAKDVNTRFGNLGRQGLLKSRTAQDTARLFALAPQWNEGLVRSELGFLKQTGEWVYNKATGQKVASGLLMRSVGGLLLAQFAANQLINYYTRGYPTWDNKEEGIGAKLSAFIPDKIGSSSGFFLHPAGLAAETVHLITTRWEKSGSLRTALQDYMKGRKSSLDDALAALWSGDTKDLVPYPIPTGAAASVLGKAINPKEPIKEEYPGAVQRQALSSFGVKTDLVPSKVQQIQRLAREFEETKGIKHKQEPVSDYAKLNEALRTGDKEGAVKELDELKKTHSLATLIRYYAQEYPHVHFTGKKEREEAFERSLTKDQRDIYKEVLDERKETARKGLNLVRGPSRFSAFNENDNQP